VCCCLAIICHSLATTPTIFVSSLTATVCCMPTCTISRDLKARIPALFHQHGFNIKEICGLLDIKKTVVYQALSYARAYGVPYNPHAHKPGRKCALSQGDLKFIVTLLNHRHSLYLDEIQEQLRTECGTSVSITTLLYTLRHLHYSRKGASAHALERDDLLRSAFMTLRANPNENSIQLRKLTNQISQNSRLN
jgi:transposase